MMPFMRLTNIHWKRLFARPLNILVFFLLPLLLTIPSGLAASSNDASQIVPVICDLAQNPGSRSLVKEILSSNAQWLEMSETEAELALKQGDIQALVIIPENFNPLPVEASSSFLQSLRGSKRSEAHSLVVASGSRSETIVFLWEELATKLVAQLFEAKLIETLAPHAEVHNISVDKVSELFYTETAQREAEFGNIGLEVTGIELQAEQKRPLIHLPRYNVELLFLSLFAIVAVVHDSSSAHEEKLLRSFASYAKNGTTQFLALFLVGFCQMVFLHIVLYLFDHELSLQGSVFAVLGTFLLLQIAIAYIFRLIPQRVRLLSAILYTLISATVGGCFISLPSQLLMMFVPYSTHAWAMAALGNLNVPLVPVFAGAFILMLLAHSIYYFAARHSTR